MDRKITKEIADQVFTTDLLDELAKRNVDRKHLETEMIPEVPCDVRSKPLGKEDIEDVFAEQVNKRADAIGYLLDIYKEKEEKNISDFVHMASRLVSDAGLISKCVEDEKIVEKLDDADKAKEVVDDAYEYVKEEGDIQIPKGEQEFVDLEEEKENILNDLNAMADSGDTESDAYYELKAVLKDLDKRIKDTSRDLGKATALTDKAEKKKKK